MVQRSSAMAAVALVSVLTAAQQAQAVSIVFNYSLDTAGFFSTQQRSLLETAGSFFSSRLSDNLLAFNSSGVNQFDANFINPQTGALETLSGYSAAENAITVFVGARNLGGSTLGQGGAGGYSVSGYSSFLEQSTERGQGTVRGAAATDVALWGGAIAFNSESNWFFDSSLDSDDDIIGSDFYSVALHELGHVLGLGGADSWSNLSVGGSFVGAEVQALTAGGALLNAAGDHWADDTQSTFQGAIQQASMTSAITAGSRKHFTALDMAALSDIGWQVSEVPVPAAAWLFGSALLGLVGLRRQSAQRR